VAADRTQYAAQDGLKLPALTHDLQIDCTSPSFSIPKKVNFRYGWRATTRHGKMQVQDGRPFIPTFVQANIDSQ
jgi:hypothetical protein